MQEEKEEGTIDILRMHAYACVHDQRQTAFRLST